MEARAVVWACLYYIDYIGMDISIIFKLAAVGIIVTIVCQVLKKSDRDDIATVVSIVGLVIALTVAVSMIGDLFEVLREMFEVT